MDAINNLQLSNIKEQEKQTNKYIDKPDKYINTRYKTLIYNTNYQLEKLFQKENNM